MSIYLDYSADTPPDERVLSEYIKTASEDFANPNSAHGMGAAAKNVIDSSLAKTAELLNVSSDELIFSSGASESNNLAIKGIAWANRRRGKHIVSTFLEHSSVSGSLTYLQEQGWEIDLVNILPNGKVDTEIAQIVSGYPNCRLHVDLTQAVGKIPLDLRGVHTAGLAPHKFYGLKGCGLLYKSKGTVIEPLIHGGASTTIYRSGTPDTPAAAAFVTALELALAEFDERYEHVKALNDRLREHFSGCGRIAINSPDDAVAHILNISVSGIKGEEMRRLLNERGVCVSVKSACSVANTPSRSVMAMTHDRKRALSSWRISLSHLTTDVELENFIMILDDIIEHNGR